MSVIASLAIGLVVGLCRPILGAQNSESASLAEIQSMDSVLYRMQRDIRQSDPNGIFLCSKSAGSVSCDQASTFATPTDVLYLAVLTARAAGSGTTTWDPDGRPVWTGFNVYWLAPDDHGSSTLYCAFSAAIVPPGTGPLILNPDVANAVEQASSVTAPDVVTRNVIQLQSMVDITSDRVALRLTTQTTVADKTNQLSVQGDAYARN